jgi:hypothetical protein
MFLYLTFQPFSCNTQINISYTDRMEWHRLIFSGVIISKKNMHFIMAVMNKDVGGDTKTKSKLHGLSPRANYTDRAAAACRRSDCQPLRIEGATW